MRTFSTACLVLALAAAPAFAASPDLARAEKQFEAFNYKEAEKSLIKALAAPNNDRASIIRIYELRGIIDATVGKKTAVEHFRRLVAIDPEHAISRDLGPKVLQPFYEAKARLDEFPAIKIEIATTLVEKKQILAVVVKNDSMGLGAKVKLSWKAKGGEWQSRLEPSKGPGFEQIVESDTVEYYAQLFSPNNGLLVEQASEAAPLKVEPPPPAPEPQKVVVVQQAPEQARPLSGARKASIAIMAVGVATLGGAIAAGAVSSSARQQIENPQRDESGKPIGMTPERIQQLQDTTVSGAVASNVMLGLGIGLAGVGLVLFIVDPGGGAAKVAVAPAPGGVVVAGSF